MAGCREGVLLQLRLMAIASKDFQGSLLAQTVSGEMQL